MLIGMEDIYSTSNRFIKLVGYPETLNNDETIETKESKQLSSNLIIKVLDATTEDPFTLESFDTLIQQHAEKNKDFILAKVATADPVDDSKFYYSYYSAHHINKILFRTQPEQGLLHRMKAKNVSESVKPLFSLIKSSSMSVTSKKTLHIKKESISSVEITATSALDNIENDFSIAIDINNGFNSPTREKVDSKMGRESRRWSIGGNIQSPLKTFQPQQSRIKKHNSLSSFNPENLNKIQSINDYDYNKEQSNNDNSISSSSTDEFTNNNTMTSSMPKDDDPEKNQMIFYEALFYATDDDFLTRSSVRQYFKSNALDYMDAQLFTINAVPQSPHATNALNSTPPSAQLERIMTDNNNDNNGYLMDPFITNSRRGSASQEVTGSWWSRPLHGIRMNKGLKWLVLMYMVFGFLLIRFVVSETYAYLMAFLLMLCLFLVFCVGSGVKIWGREER
ncbi:1721_t:CDS:2 [Entrophospora sp. SA101]|nr:4290_t:CDS:2 [Entrophospora sp. SA101]CAJ0827767.1 1721_t:CDS:2 [Entrophospora sp. SA101]